MTTSRSTVESSPRKFEISNVAVDEAPALVQLSDVDGLSVSQQVTVVAKVMSLMALEKVKTKEGKELQKQECDESGGVRLVLWELGQ